MLLVHGRHPLASACWSGQATLIGNNATDPPVLRAAQPGDTFDLYMIGLGVTSDASRFVGPL